MTSPGASREAEAALLEVEDLTVDYHPGGRGKPVRAVDGVSLTIEGGSTLGIVGESGSGKSSVGRAILGLVQPSRGCVTYRGKDITGLTGRRRVSSGISIQAIFQDPFSSLNPSRTIASSVTEGLRESKGLKRAEARMLAASMLERVGLDSSALDRYPSQFSGGQRQRIAVARGLVSDPKLIVCDEPVSALDLSVQAQVLNLFQRLQSELGIAYLFIAHDISVVRFLSHRIMVMYRGRVMEVGPAQAVHSQPHHPYTKALLSAIPSVSWDLKAPTLQADSPGGLTPLPGAPDFCPFVQRCPFAAEVCREKRPRLEQTECGAWVACHRWEDLEVRQAE